MAEGIKLDKLKDQYVDDVLAIVPLAQAIFIIIMVMTADKMIAGNSVSFVDAISSFGLKTTLGPDKGRFWEIGVLSIFISFSLAVANTYLLRIGLASSIRLADLGPKLSIWRSEATAHIAGLSEAQKNVIQNSFRLEMEIRLRKYKAARVSTEIVASIASAGVYATVLMIILALDSANQLRFSLPDCAILAAATIFGIMLHRASLRYAIAKIIPMKVYIGVLSGEIVFFEEIST